MVDDQESFRSAARLVVDMVDGFELIGEAGSGEEGLELAGNLEPDLILMDINMPGVDGFMLTSKIKDQPKLSRIPIIAVTANVMKGDRERTLAAGCDGYIQKPIDVDNLPNQISQFIPRPT